MFYGCCFSMSSFLHHLADTFSPFLIHYPYEINTCGQVGNVDLQRFAFALGSGHLLPERVEDFSIFQVFARDGDKTRGGVGVDCGEDCGFGIF